MKTSFINVIAIVMIGVLSGSVLPTVFPGSSAVPVFVFSFAVALALSRGFLGSLPAVIALGLFADIATLGRIGILSGFAVGTAYTAGFFSRRFVVEHAALAVVFSGILSGFSAMVFPVFSDMLLYGAGAALSGPTEIFSITRASLLIMSGIACFLFATVSIRKYDELVSRLDPGPTLRG
jgi:hypothetical protein